MTIATLALLLVTATPAAPRLELTPPQLLGEPGPTDTDEEIDGSKLFRTTSFLTYEVASGIAVIGVFALTGKAARHFKMESLPQLLAVGPASTLFAVTQMFSPLVAAWSLGAVYDDDWTRAIRPAYAAKAFELAVVSLSALVGMLGARTLPLILVGVGGLAFAAIVHLGGGPYAIRRALEVNGDAVARNVDTTSATPVVLAQPLGVGAIIPLFGLQL